MARKNNNKKVCTFCGNSKSVTEFYRDKSQKGGYAVWCKSCEATYNKAYFRALKLAGVTRKIDLQGNEKATTKFNRAMRDVRVRRGENTRVNAPRAKAKANVRGKGKAKA